MYESFGFRSAGIRRRYYHDNNEDALIMWRTHPASLGARGPEREETPGLSNPLLGIETSCDDTCAAVVTPEGEILSNVISSQARFHERYGGVVPEVASRHHLELINAVVDEALERAEDPAGISARLPRPAGPGLIGALLIGLSTAKALAAANRLPFVPVDHLHGHVAANFLEPDPIEPPFLCLIASGGHTLLARGRASTADTALLGETRDDAAGEALDKAARLLGLGLPGRRRDRPARAARAIPRRSTFRSACAVTARSTSASAG